jgi:Family of unknown function (DUF5681)
VSSSDENLNPPLEQQKVGYGRPPESTRFKKGQSGNPHGRPKGSLDMRTVLMRTLREKVTITENGKQKTVTKMEVVIKRLVNKAASGDLRASHELLTLTRVAEAEMNPDETPAPEIGDLDRQVMQGILKRIQVLSEQEQGGGK